MKEIEEQMAEIIDSHCWSEPETIRDITQEILSEVTIYVKCSECNGFGELAYTEEQNPWDQKERCHKCKGTGKETITLKQAIERLQG